MALDNLNYPILSLAECFFWVCVIDSIVNGIAYLDEFEIMLYRDAKGFGCIGLGFLLRLGSWLVNSLLRLVVSRIGRFDRVR